MPLYRELAVFGDKVLQIGVVDALKQLLKAFGRKPGQHHHHTLAGAQAHIGLCQRLFIAGEKNAAILHPDIFHAKPAQFISRQTFEAKQRWRDQFKFTHKSSIMG